MSVNAIQTQQVRAILEEEQAQVGSGAVDVRVEDDTGPYIQYRVVVRKLVHRYNPNYVATHACLCGHSYARHFDPYEGMAAVGCKYCPCNTYVPDDGTYVLSPFERHLKYGNEEYRLENYMLQWELFHDVIGGTLDTYLGASLEQWLRSPWNYPDTPNPKSLACDEFIEVTDY